MNWKLYTPCGLAERISDFIDLHASWRNAYKKYWYEKWKRAREIAP
jgi:hypothetical protein